MTVSSTHSINMNGLHQALTALGLAQTTCLLYFVVPPDIYPVFKNPATDPPGTPLPNNVSLMVLELPLRRVGDSTSSMVTTVGGKRKVIDTDRSMSWRICFSVPYSLTLCVCVPVTRAAIVCGHARAASKEAYYHYL